jgi:hypothetical protein
MILRKPLTSAKTSGSDASALSVRMRDCREEGREVGGMHSSLLDFTARIRRLGQVPMARGRVVILLLDRYSVSREGSEARDSGKEEALREQPERLSREREEMDWVMDFRVGDLLGGVRRAFRW